MHSEWSSHTCLSVRYTRRTMTEAKPTKDGSGKSEATQAMLREVARDMEVGLYRRYSEPEAAKILGISEKELAQLREEGRIAYLRLGDKAVGFFGCQVLTYLLECVVAVDASSKPVQEPSAQPARPTVSAAAELISVEDTIALMGIGRTKLYELLNTNEIESVKIGRRTLIRRASLRRFTEAETV